MKNIPFVIWVIGWAVYGDWNFRTSTQIVSDEARLFADIVFIVIWVWVAWLLYEK